MRGLLYVKYRKFENFSWNGGIAANENETPFFLIFPARMPKCKTKIELIEVQIWEKMLL